MSRIDVREGKERLHVVICLHTCILSYYFAPSHLFLQLFRRSLVYIWPFVILENTISYLPAYE